MEDLNFIPGQSTTEAVGSWMLTHRLPNHVQKRHKNDFCTKNRLTIKCNTKSAISNSLITALLSQSPFFLVQVTQLCCPKTTTTRTTTVVNCYTKEQLCQPISPDMRPFCLMHFLIQLRQLHCISVISSSNNSSSSKPQPPQNYKFITFRQVILQEITTL